jgi:hypothetical protein
MRTHFSSLDIWDEKYDILGAPELNGLSLNPVCATRKSCYFSKDVSLRPQVKRWWILVKRVASKLLIIAYTKFEERN